MKAMIKILLGLVCWYLFSSQLNAQSWTQLNNFGSPSTPNGLTGTASFVVSGKAYVLTGEGSSGVNTFVWEYNPSNDSWINKGTFPGGARIGAVAFAINGKGYIGLGFSQQLPLSNPFYKDFWEYNPTTNQWTQKNNFPGSARAYAVSFVLNSKGYVTNGAYELTPSDNIENPAYSNDTWEYNSTNDIWIQKANFTGVPRAEATGFSLNGKGYLATGADGILSLKKDLWEYDPNTNIWTQKASLLQSSCISTGAKERIDAIGFSIGTKGYLGFGLNTFALNDFWEYDPTQNIWTDISPQLNGYAVPRRMLGTSFVINNIGYVGMGYTI